MDLTGRKSTQRISATQQQWLSFSFQAWRSMTFAASSRGFPDRGFASVHDLSLAAVEVRHSGRGRLAQPADRRQSRPCASLIDPQDLAATAPSMAAPSSTALLCFRVRQW